MSIFSDRLKEARVSKGMTQAEVIKKLNCSRNKYASWEQGRTQPSIEDIDFLCDLFDVSADYLLGRSDF